MLQKSHRGKNPLQVIDRPMVFSCKKQLSSLGIERENSQFSGKAIKILLPVSTYVFLRLHFLPGIQTAFQIRRNTVDGRTQLSSIKPDTKEFIKM